MIARILLTIAVLLSSLPVRAAWDIGGALEEYRWVEYPEEINGNPRELGLRSALFVNWTEEGEQELLFAWRAKLYAGTVNYDTYLMAPPHEPVSTKTDYNGVASEGQMFYRYNLGTYKLDQIGGLGLDFWRRGIRSNGGSQFEDYSILYARAGLRLSKSRVETGLHGELGVKFPVATNEDAHLDSMGYTSNPALSPKGAVSGYAEIGYRINPRFDVLGYYDSWRFGRSADVMVNTPADAPGTYWLIHQPKSDMDALGIKLLVSF